MTVSLTAVDHRELALTCALRAHCLSIMEAIVGIPMVDAGVDPVDVAAKLYLLSCARGVVDVAAGYISYQRSSPGHVRAAEWLAHWEPSLRPELYLLDDLKLEGQLRWEDRGRGSEASIREWYSLVSNAFIPGTLPPKKTPVAGIPDLLIRRLEDAAEAVAHGRWNYTKVSGATLLRNLAKADAGKVY